MSFAGSNLSLRGLAKSFLIYYREAVGPIDNDAFLQRLTAARDSARGDNGGHLGRRDTSLPASLTGGGGGGGGGEISSTSGGGGTSDSSKGIVTDPNSSSDKNSENTLEAVMMEILVSTVASLALYTMGVGVVNIYRFLAGNYGDGSGTAGDVDQPNATAKSRLYNLLKKRGREPKQPLNLTSHETHLAEDIIDPDDIDEGFGDIGGMDNLKQEIWELAILPLMRPELFQSKSKLLQQPSGILLYGKPGCGKTLIAKAIAKESSAVFIPIKLSKILNKWVGESNKLVAATFSLARKLAPSVIFLDEVHCFLSDSVDPSTSKSMESLKAEFLTLWDGVSTNGKHAPVLVLGATNHPHLIDQAILRRMPRTFAIPLPGPEGRLQILRVLLQDQDMTADAEAFLPSLARRLTKGYSGSDLKELCRTAAREPIRRIVSEEARRAVSGEKPKPRDEKNQSSDDDSSEEDAETKVPDPVSKEDFMTALKKVKRTGQAAVEYGRKAAAENSAQNSAHELEQTMEAALANMGIDLSDLMQLLAKNAPTQVQRPRPTRQNGSDEDSSEEHKGSDDDDIGDVPPPLPE